jgi:hypothetical protein
MAMPFAHIHQTNKSVENEFNRKLENVKAELRTKEAQIDALRMHLDIFRDTL